MESNKSLEIKDAYNKIAHIYNQELWDDMPYTDNINKFMELLNGDEVIDLGCAMGSFTKILADHGLKVDGIDISDRFIDIAKQRVKNVNFMVMNMLDMHIHKKYDGVMAINSTIHIEKKDMLDLFKNINRLLKDNGIFFVILQEGKGEKYIDEPFDESVKEWVSFYKVEEIEELFARSGFDIISHDVIRNDADFELGHDQLAYYLKKKNL